MPGVESSEVESKPRLNPNRLRFSKINDRRSGGGGARSWFNTCRPDDVLTLVLFSLNLSSLSIYLSSGACNSLLLRVIRGLLPAM